ncbi:MAG: hypothetical protein ACT4P4_04025 [Betaproteobacteria bacterium]
MAFLAGEIAIQSMRARLPSISGLEFYAQNGGLMNYSPDLMQSFAKEIPTFVDRILKGAKPADLLVQQVTNYRLVLKLEDRPCAWPCSPVWDRRARRPGDRVSQRRKSAAFQPAQRGRITFPVDLASERENVPVALLAREQTQAFFDRRTLGLAAARPHRLSKQLVVDVNGCSQDGPPISLFPALLEQCDIGEILRAGHRPLVADQVPHRQHRHGLSGKARIESRGPRFIELDGFDGGEDINAQRRHADLEDGSRAGEVIDGEVVEWCAVCGQCLQDASSVDRIRPHPDVEIPCSPHMTVRRHRLRADHQKLNAVRVEF